MIGRVALASALWLGADRATPQDAPLPPEGAAASFTVPQGFRATLFAGEPDVVQPIAMAFDDRGRLWVVECLSYPDWTADGTGHDRVVVFEDADGDGRHDRRTVFFDQGANLTGIELGFGGVWLCSTPNLVFVPDRDGDGRPDGPAEVLLDGWDITAKHNAFNGLAWGPDGWLYGCNGILSNSRVGPPGTPDEDRVALNCGVWRYHPTRRVFEVVAHGTTNPWGVDWDDYGEMFITNCVIKHAFHIVPGGHYERMFGQDLNPYVFGLLPSCADHIHWAGGYWDTEGVDKPINDAFGGGHAHCGTMVYLGDNWPAEYRNGLFTVNLHGRRVNHDRLERHGSGYVARHAPDVLRSGDPWFRGVALTYGPDGGVYLADWHDTGECHDYDDVRRETGRIFKIAYGQPRRWRGDIATLSDARLVDLQTHQNDWHVRHARRVLQERAEAKRLKAATRRALVALLSSADQTPTRLRAMRALHVTGGVEESLALAALSHADEDVRAVVVRLELDDEQAPDAFRDRMLELAAFDPSPRVRLAIASALQRMPQYLRDTIVVKLVEHSEDADDPNLPLMYWYAMEPLATLGGVGGEFARRFANIPLLRRYAARTAGLHDALSPMVRALADTPEPERQRDVLLGLHDALHGRRGLSTPDNWGPLAARLAESDDAEVRETALALSVGFGDGGAAARVAAIARDVKADVGLRERSLSVLIDQRAPGTLELLQQLLGDEALHPAAIRGLAVFGDAQTPRLLLERYASLDDAAKADAVQTLASRSSYALALVDALAAGRVPREDVSAFVARHIAALGDAELAVQLEQVWGAVRPAAEGKAEKLASWKAQLTAEALAAADTSHGRAVFDKHCAACHRLFDAGGRIGPELTGAQRGNLDYVLENLLDPSAVVPRDYQMTVVELADGRVVTGIVRGENEDSLDIQAPNDLVLIDKREIETRQQSPLSMMPEGLLDRLTPDDVRDLLAYLASPAQVPAEAAPHAVE